MIEVNNLTKRYGNNTAVDDLSFSVEKGQIYGFLGPNGAGKSTTMNMLTGFLAASSGSVIIDGFDILKDAKKAKRNIGYLPEIPPVYPDMTIREFLHFAGELKGLSYRDRKQKVYEVMDKTGISDMKDRLIRNLSKGYRQRAGLAQAILGDPDVIILDEPTVGLDPGQIIEIRQLLKDMRKDHTIILSSHILQEISAVCDHIMIISHGKLLVSDTAENISSSSKGVSRVELVVKGELNKAESTAKAVEGADDVSAENGQEEGTVKLIIKHPVENDLREKIFLSFAASNLPILEMSSSSESLEDVYLRLTGERGRADAAGVSGDTTDNDVKEDDTEQSQSGEPLNDNDESGVDEE